MKNRKACFNPSLFFTLMRHYDWSFHVFFPHSLRLNLYFIFPTIISCIVQVSFKVNRTGQARGLKLPGHGVIIGFGESFFKYCYRKRYRKLCRSSLPNTFRSMYRRKLQSLYQYNFTKPFLQVNYNESF